MARHLSGQEAVRNYQIRTWKQMDFGIFIISSQMILGGSHATKRMESQPKHTALQLNPQHRMPVSIQLLSIGQHRLQRPAVGLQTRNRQTGNLGAVVPPPQGDRSREVGGLLKELHLAGSHRPPCNRRLSCDAADRLAWYCGSTAQR